MAETAVLVKLRPRFQELRDARTYSEVEVKQVLYSFARDLGCKWRADKLRRFIEAAFNYD